MPAPTDISDTSDASADGRYPATSRFIRALAPRLGAAFEDLDDGNGYLFRVSRGGRCFVAGAGRVCVWPVNGATAYTISRDKAHTQRLLDAAGLPTVPGALFFCGTRHAALQPPGRSVAEAQAYAASLGFPVFCKPNRGSRGDHAEIVDNAAALAAYIDRLAPDHDAFLVQPVIAADEVRVFVQDGRAVYAAHKAAPALVGDGVSTWAMLLEGLNATLAGTGVSAFPPSVVALSGSDSDHVPAAGERLVLAGRRNVAAGGASERIVDAVPDAPVRLAIAAVATLGLRVGAVDLFELPEDGGYRIIEVNGNPSLASLDAAGRRDLIDAIWTAIIEELLG
jgi:glutathione synthase/RimK-type ligase-like ATP-grasp enzyme